MNRATIATMKADIVLVDGPNLFNAVGAILAAKLDSEDLRPYMRDWFDVDRLVSATMIGDEMIWPRLGIVIYHSANKLGKGRYELKQPEAQLFWERQSTLPRVSCHKLDIPGRRQTYNGKCKEGHDVAVADPSEKGVDSSIITHLFDSSEHWEQACIFSEDGDMVPAIEALRRRGKQVTVATTLAHSAVARVALERFGYSQEWLHLDFRTWELFRDFREGGKAERVREVFRNRGSETVHLHFGGNHGDIPDCVLDIDSAPVGEDETEISARAKALEFELSPHLQEWNVRVQLDRDSALVHVEPAKPTARGLLALGARRRNDSLLRRA